MTMPESRHRVRKRTVNTDDGFNIRTFIRKVREEFPSLTPRQLTREVLERIPPADRMPALEQCLRVVVSNMITGAREDRPFLRKPPVVRSGHDNNKPWRVPHDYDWRRYLDQPFHIGAHEYIPFGDCTIAHLERGIKHREHIIAANQASAQRLSDWVKFMYEHGVARIRELPEDVLKTELTGGETP